MSLVFRLARRNLFHDRLRFIATLVGIVFSIVLVTVQMGLFLSFDRMVTTMIDHAAADLWIVPLGTKCFEDPSLLDEHARQQAPVGPGDCGCDPGHDRIYAMAHAQRRDDAGVPGRVRLTDRRATSVESRRRQSRGPFDPRCRRGRPFVFRAPRVDRPRRQRRDSRPEGRGGGGYRRHPLVHHDPLCLHHARPRRGPLSVPRPTRRPICWSISRATRMPGAFAARLDAALVDAEVLTPAEFRSRSRSFWLFGTGAGAALFAGALLGMHRRHRHRRANALFEHQGPYRTSSRRFAPSDRRVCTSTRSSSSRRC